MDFPQTTNAPTGLGKAYDDLLYKQQGLILWADYGNPNCKPAVFEDGCIYKNLAPDTLVSGSDTDRGLVLEMAKAGVLGTDIAWEETRRGYPHGAIDAGSAANTWGQIRMGLALRQYFIANPDNRYLFFFVGEVTGPGAAQGDPLNPIMTLASNASPNVNFITRLTSSSVTNDGQSELANIDGGPNLYAVAGETWAMWTDAGWNGVAGVPVSAIMNTLMVGAPNGWGDNAGNGTSRIGRMCAIWDLTAGGVAATGYDAAIDMARAYVKQEYGPGGAWRGDAFTPPSVMLG